MRQDGWSLVTLAEHHGIPADEGIADVDWLKLAGESRWPVLMKDEKIRYRPAERAAVMGHGVRGFYLTSGNMTAQKMADVIIANRDAIWRLARGAGPALFSVSRGAVRQIDLSD